MDRLLRNVIVGSGVTLLSMFVIKGMSLVNSIIAARLLGPVDYGAFSVIANLQNVVGAIACFGIPLGIAKYVSQWKEQDKLTAQSVVSALFVILLVVSTLTAIVYLLLAPTIASDIYNDEHLVAPIRLSAVYVLLSSMSAGATTFLQGCQKIAALAKVNAAVAIVAQPIAFLSISALGLEGAVLAMAIASGLSFVILAYVAWNTLPLSWVRARALLGEKGRVKSLLSFTLPALLTSITVIPAYWIGRTVLALEWNLSSVAGFQIAESVSQLLLILPAAISAPLLPAISELYESDPKAVAHSAGSLQRIVTLVVPALSLIALPFLRFAIKLLYGVTYEDTYTAAVLMFASSTFVTIATVISNVMFGTGRVWEALKLNVIWLAFFLLAIFLLVPIGSKEGLAGTYAISYGFYMFLLLYYFHSRFEVSMKMSALFMAAYGFMILLYAEFALGLDLWMRALLASILALLYVVLGSRMILNQSEKDKLLSIIFRPRR